MTDDDYDIEKVEKICKECKEETLESGQMYFGNDGPYCPKCYTKRLDEHKIINKKGTDLKKLE